MVPFSLVKIYVFQHFFRVFFNYITQLRLREDLFVLEEMVRSAVHVHVSGEVGCAAGKGHNSNWNKKTSAGQTISRKFRFNIIISKVTDLDPCGSVFFSGRTRTKIQKYAVIFWNFHIFYFLAWEKCSVFNNLKKFKGILIVEVRKKQHPYFKKKRSFISLAHLADGWETCSDSCHEPEQRLFQKNHNKTGQGHLHKTFSERFPFLNICKATRCKMAKQKAQ